MLIVGSFAQRSRDASDYHRKSSCKVRYCLSAISWFCCLVAMNVMEFIVTYAVWCSIQFTVNRIADENKDALRAYAHLSKNCYEIWAVPVMGAMKNCSCCCEFFFYSSLLGDINQANSLPECVIYVILTNNRFANGFPNKVPPVVVYVHEEKISYESAHIRSFVSIRISTAGFYRERRMPAIFAKDQYACLLVDSNQKEPYIKRYQPVSRAPDDGHEMFNEEVVNNNNRRNAVCQCEYTD